MGAGERERDPGWSPDPRGADAPPACLSRAEELIREGDLEGAARILREGLQRWGESAELYNRLGIVHAHRKEWPIARACFQRAMELDPCSPAPLNNLGNLCREEGRLDEAIGYYEGALRLDPEYATAYHNLGVVYKAQGRLDRAVGAWKQARRIELRRSRETVRAEVRGWGPRISWIGLVLFLLFLLWLFPGK